MCTTPKVSGVLIFGEIYAVGKLENIGEYYWRILYVKSTLFSHTIFCNVGKLCLKKMLAPRIQREDVVPLPCSCMRSYCEGEHIGTFPVYILLLRQGTFNKMD